MTTKPIKTDGPFPDPVQCPIHADALEEIREIVLDTRKEVIGLKDMDGPIVALDKRVGAVEVLAGSAHERIDTLVTTVQTDHDKTTGLVARVSIATAVLVVALSTTIGHFFQ